MNISILSPIVSLITKFIGSKNGTNIKQTSVMNFGTIGKQTITNTIQTDNHYQDNTIIQPPVQDNDIKEMFNRIKSSVNHEEVISKDYGRRTLTKQFYILIGISLVSFIALGSLNTYQRPFISMLIAVGVLLTGTIALHFKNLLLRPEIIYFLNIIVEDKEEQSESQETSNGVVVTKHNQITFLLENGKRLTLRENTNLKMMERDHGVIAVSEKDVIVDFKRVYDNVLV